MQVLRLLKHLYLSHMSGPRRLLGLKPHTLHVLQLAYVSFIIINFCGCIWFFVAREAHFEVGGVSHAPVDSQLSAALVLLGVLAG